MNPEQIIASFIEQLVAFGMADRAGCDHVNDAAFSAALMLLGAAKEDGLTIDEAQLGFMAGAFDE